ncbi:MAG TPA: hypothetical protein VJJ82_03545 [Candidatus Nanoarchaeia archaeon]|nr:hypothetical protein [Candidatus Nanoarchaeia archaeon]
MPRKQSIYGSLKGRVGDMSEMVTDRARELQEKTGDYIAENPMKAGLILFGVGVVVGAVLTKLMERK